MKSFWRHCTCYITLHTFILTLYIVNYPVSATLGIAHTIVFPKSVYFCEPLFIQVLLYASLLLAEHVQNEKNYLICLYINQYSFNFLFKKISFKCLTALYKLCICVLCVIVMLYGSDWTNIWLGVNLAFKKKSSELLFLSEVIIILHPYIL